MEWKDMRGRDFRGQDLSEANMEWCDFSGADFTGADMSRGRFAFSLFRKANLQHVQARRADFRQADMARARLDYGDFTLARFEDASLYEASAQYAILRNIQASTLTASGADFSHAALAPMPIETHTILTDCRFRGAIFRWADLSHCTLDYSDFYEADLTNANLYLARAAFCDFRHARLEGVNVTEANLLGSAGDILVASFGHGVAVAAGRSVTIGVDTHPIEYWLANWPAYAQRNGYSRAEADSYLDWLHIVAKRLGASSA